MTNLKTAALAVLALSVSGTAFAGMYAVPPAMGCTAGNVTVPCEKKGWSIGAEALYVQVGNVGQVSNTTTTTTVNGVNYINESDDSLTPDWAWAFRVEAAYMFGTGNDINLNWTHFVKDTTQTTVAEGIDGYYTIDTVVGAQDTVSTDIDNKFDAVNFEFGQMVNFGEKVSTRFHAGLQYADIRQTLSQSAWNSANTLDYDYTNIESKFSGIGPRAGADTNYAFGNGVSIFGNFAAGLLIGDLSTDITVDATDTEGTVTDEATEDASSSNSIVPEAEAKLGVAYTKPMAQGDLKIEAGYELVNYWDASTINGNDYNSEETSFNYQGIFLGLKWLGNA
jgi:hypothetical protein